MDLGFLSHLYAVEGPFATVYLDLGEPSEDRRTRVDLGWRALREELVTAGADDATLGALDERVAEEPHPGAGRVLVAAQGRVLLDHHHDRAPLRPTATWQPLPHVMPLVAMLADRVPHVVVVADRTGADITVYGDLGRLVGTSEVQGDDDEIRRVSPGGWSQRRYQNRAEDSWEKNAGQVAARVNRLVSGISPALVVAAGDVRARQFLREHLSSQAQEILVEVEEGGRGAGASEESLDQRVAQLVAEAAVRRQLELLDTYREEIGQQDRAVTGLATTVDVIRKAQVETLVLHDEPASEAVLFVGPEPLHLAMTRTELLDLGVDEHRIDEVRADAAIVRALVGSAAGIVVVPGGDVELTDGIGAVLRYVDASTLTST
jgi:hypothetical protein